MICHEISIYFRYVTALRYKRFSSKMLDESKIYFCAFCCYFLVFLMGNNNKNSELGSATDTTAAPTNGSLHSEQNSLTGLNPAIFKKWEIFRLSQSTQSCCQSCQSRSLLLVSGLFANKIAFQVGNLKTNSYFKLNRIYLTRVKIEWKWVVLLSTLPYLCPRNKNPTDI